MLFKLCNALILFYILINNILQLFLDVFCNMYLDYIIIYFNILKKYITHVQQMLEVFRKAQLFIKLKKYKFYWNKKQQQIFNQLKTVFININILIYFNSDWKIMMKTNVLNYILVKCLSQKNSDSRLIKLVTFYFQKLIKSEWN